MPTTREFNDALQADVFYIKRQDTKFSIMSLVDVGTRYMACYLLTDETSESYIQALEKMWLRHFWCTPTAHH